MKVGDYVRTKYGIAKYISDKVTKVTIYKVIDKDIVYDNVEGWEDVLLDNEIIKSSPNIIDLIEVGDIINFGYVYTQTKEVKNIKVHRIKNEADLILQKFYFNNEKRVLKSIVTKEQFESMEYKIGE